MYNYVYLRRRLNMVNTLSPALQSLTPCSNELIEAAAKSMIAANQMLNNKEIRFTSSESSGSDGEGYESSMSTGMAKLFAMSNKVCSFSNV